MFVAIDDRAAGLIGVADPIKTSTPEAIRDLHQAGVQAAMSFSSVSVIGNALRLRRISL